MYDDVITEGEVQRIHGIEDDSTRNNEITLGYHHLSELLAEFTRSTSNNWCVWAKWTSKTIGVGIRWGEVRDLARSEVERDRDRQLDRWAAGRATTYFATGSAIRLLTWASRAASRRLADGNRDVFCEIGTCVTRMVERFGSTDQLDATELAAFLESIEPVGPAGSLGPGPRAAMEAAARCFIEARFAEGSARDELVLAGNINFAAYEQARLQAVVEASLWAPADWPFRPVHAIGRRLPGRLGPLVADAARLAQDPLRRVAVRLATRRVLVVVTGDEVLRLGCPLPPPPGASTIFPDGEPTHPALAEVCAQFLDGVDATQPLARCWTELDERIRFTAALFRSRHHHRALRERPMLDPEQTVIDTEREEAASQGATWVAETF